MIEPVKILSPTGCVHIAAQENITVSGSREYTTLCGHASGRIEATAWFLWPKADGPVTCRRCLAQSENPAHRLKELTIKASDLESRFYSLAKGGCEYFQLEELSISERYWRLPAKFCLHKRRLGTKKNPVKCRLCDCPLKYER
jgi:hypothetical protein